METLSIKVKHGKMDIYMPKQQNLDNLQKLVTLPTQKYLIIHTIKYLRTPE